MQGAPTRVPGEPPLLWPGRCSATSSLPSSAAFLTGQHQQLFANADHWSAVSCCKRRHPHMMCVCPACSHSLSLKTLRSKVTSPWIGLNLLGSILLLSALQNRYVWLQSNYPEAGSDWTVSHADAVIKPLCPRRGNLQPEYVPLQMGVTPSSAQYLLLTHRQRTIRELEVGQTLFKDGQGRWVIRHGPAHYKTGKAYGERPPMLLAPHIYPELEAFLEKWRSELKPEHNFLFSTANGRPLTGVALYKLFYTSCYRYAP